MQPGNRLRPNHLRPLSLLAPALVIMVLIYGYSMVTFLKYSFLRFQHGQLIEEFTLQSYQDFFADSFYLLNVWNTIVLGLWVTLGTLVIGYPVAYALYKIQRESLRQWLSVIIFAPLVVSVVVRAYGWMVLLSTNGAVNWLLMRTGLIQQPLTLVNNLTGVIIATVHVLLPFMVFAILSVLMQLQPALKEASADLGASRWQTFWRVTFPLSLRGVVSGAQMVFPLVLSAFVTPALLGGGRVLVLSTSIYRYTVDLNWPMAAVAGITLLGITLTVSGLLNRALKQALGEGSGVA